MPGKGGKYCVAGFSNQRSCRNSSMSKGISMHKFPFNKRRRAAWTSFVRKHRPNWTPTGTSTLCSAHFLETDYNQRVDIDVPEVQGCSTGSIKLKKFLNAKAIPTVDDFEAACKTFPENASTNVPLAPNLPEHSADIRAKRRLLRDLHSPQFDTRSALQNDEVFTGENEELFTGKNLGTETPHDENIVQEMPFETPNNRENDLVKVKSKLKSSQQKCSKHKKTIKRLQLQLKIARDQARDNGIDDGGRSEESEDEAYYNGLKSEPDGGIDLDGNVGVDESELDNYLAEANEMDKMENQGDDPDWESLECGSEETDEDDSDDDAVTDSRNQVR